MSIHVLRITLRRSKPPIWRRVAVPSDITLGELHEVIQIAMGWTDDHLHGFTLEDESLKRSPDEVAKLYDQGRWDDLFAATRGMRIFSSRRSPLGDPLDTDGEDEDAVTLAEVCPQVKRKLTYEYDFGDGWEHIIETQKIEQPKPDVNYPVCLAGRKACPPEDCGGIYGYYHMLEALADPNHAAHNDCAEWLEEDFDPDTFDIDEVNQILTAWRKAGA